MYIIKIIKMKICHIIIKTMCPPGCHHNRFVATHTLGHIVVKNVRAHCFHDYAHLAFVRFEYSVCVGSLI